MKYIASKNIFIILKTRDYPTMTCGAMITRKMAMKFLIIYQILRYIKMIYIRKHKDKYPNMNINQIYNSFPLIYPDRLKGNTINISKKRKTFRD